VGFLHKLLILSDIFCIRGSFEKFVDSPYYSELEICGGVVTGFFFEASDALLTTLHPLLENVLQTVDHFEISCLGAPFTWFEKPRNFMGLDLDCMADVLMVFHRSTFFSRTQNSIHISPHAISGLFQL
jgi:hypothetical protein